MSSGSHNADTGRAEIQGVDLRRVLATLQHDRRSVLPALQAIQETFGYLPEAALAYVAEEFETPLATVVGIATFYEQFSLEPRGEHVVRVCTGTACHVNDSADILAELRRALDVDPGEVTEDGQFTLADVRCVGACSLAPVVMVDDETHGEMDPETAAAVVEGYR